MQSLVACRPVDHVLRSFPRLYPAVSRREGVVPKARPSFFLAKLLVRFVLRGSATFALAFVRIAEVSIVEIARVNLSPPRSLGFVHNPARRTCDEEDSASCGQSSARDGKSRRRCGSVAGEEGGESPYEGPSSSAGHVEKETSIRNVYCRGLGEAPSIRQKMDRRLCGIRRWGADPVAVGVVGRTPSRSTHPRTLPHNPRPFHLPSDLQRRGIVRTRIAILIAHWLILPVGWVSCPSACWSQNLFLRSKKRSEKIPGGKRDAHRYHIE